MELLLGAVIVVLVLAVVLATHSDAAPDKLTDDGLREQILAVRGWILHFETLPQPGPKLKRLHRQKQLYLAALRQEWEARQPPASP